MPTVLRAGPYRVYWYSHEPNEPPHVHIDRDDLSAKFWLSPVTLARGTRRQCAAYTQDVSLSRLVARVEPSCPHLQNWPGSNAS